MLRQDQQSIYNNNNNNHSSSHGNKSIIFAQIDFQNGFNILKERFYNLSEQHQWDILTGKQLSIWLLRESSVPGMLTAQWLKTVKEDGVDTIGGVNKRFFLTRNGWIVNSKTPGSDEFKQIITHHGGFYEEITAQNAQLHLGSLLEKLKESGLNPENCIHPTKQLQTQTGYLSGYVLDDKHEVPSTILFPNVIQAWDKLNPELRSRLMCPLRDAQEEAKPMQDPVILTQDLLGGNLQVGVSYERKHVEDYCANHGYELTADMLYPNRLLQSLSNLLLEKIPQEKVAEKFSELDEELKDIFTSENIEHPKTTPSGFTFGAVSLEQWKENQPSPNKFSNPFTRSEVNNDSVVDNISVENFIKDWVTFYRPGNEPQPQLENGGLRL